MLWGKRLTDRLLKTASGGARVDCHGQEEPRYEQGPPVQQHEERAQKDVEAAQYPVVVAVPVDEVDIAISVYLPEVVRGIDEWVELSSHW